MLHNLIYLGSNRRADLVNLKKIAKISEQYVKYPISLYIIFHVILDSILFNRARSISVRGRRARRKTTPTPAVHVVASPLYTTAALGYACIQIRQRGGRICRINSAGGSGRGPARAPSNTLDFIKIHSARQAVTCATDVQTDERANRLTVLLQKAPSPFSHSSGLCAVAI